MKTSKVLSVIWDYFLMTIGSFIFVMAWTSFLIPNGLASGGMTGLCTIIQYGTGIPVGLTYPIINVLLLVQLVSTKILVCLALIIIIYFLIPKTDYVDHLMNQLDV